MDTLIRSFIILGLVLSASSSYAKVFVFENSGDWNVAANWEGTDYPGHVVDVGDSIFINADVSIPAGLSVELDGFFDGSASASITILGELIINGGANFEGELTVSGILTMNEEVYAYKPVVNSGTINANAGNIQFLESVNNSGTINVNGLFNADSEFINTNQVLVSASGELLTVGEFTNSGTVNVAGDYMVFGTLNNNANVLVSGSMSSTTFTSGIVNAAIMTITGSGDFNGTFTNASSGTFTVGSTAVAHVSDDEGAVTNEGVVNVQGELIVD